MLKELIQNLLETKTVENIIVRVGRGDKILFDEKASAQDRVLTDETLFDMASVTKMLATTTLALIAIDKGVLSPADRVEKFFPVPDEKKELTVWHLLTHTMGFGYKSLVDSGATYDNVAEHILHIPCDIPLGSDVLYSCPGFILLGKILEQIFGERLDVAFEKHVAVPLGMRGTGFLPDKTRDIVNANLKDEMRGTVNDNNCRYLGGVAGNAGVFSNLTDCTRFAKMLLAKGAPLFSEQTFALASQNHTGGMSAARGLGFLYVDGRYKQTGDLFPDGAIGHCGHTGQSLFIDPVSELYVIILSDATISSIKKHAPDPYKYSDVMKMRHDIHAAIKAELKL